MVVTLQKKPPHIPTSPPPKSGPSKLSKGEKYVVREWIVEQDKAHKIISGYSITDFIHKAFEESERGQ
jgi:hypothetical protein